jgi:hypothetical protein
MFSLNKEINQWREILLEKQTCKTSDLDELESHLRDEIDQLKLNGLSEQEAFLVGTHRLGDTKVLADEFAKVNKSLRLRKKLFFAGCVLFAYIFASYTAGVLSKIFLLLTTLLGFRGYVAGIVDPVSMVAVFILIMFLWYKLAGKKDYEGERFSKTADSFKGKLMLLSLAFILMLALMAVRMLVLVFMARTLGAQEYGQIIMPTTLFSNLCWIIKPVILMIILIYLRPAKNIKTA